MAAERVFRGHGPHPGTGKPLPGWTQGLQPCHRCNRRRGNRSPGCRRDGGWDLPFCHELSLQSEERLDRLSQAGRDDLGGA